jgi:protein-S-isoprenylcysteine O-methyltransferase Ste14
MEDKLLLVPWFIAVVYSSIPLFWFAIHPVAGRWQQMRRSPYRVLLPLWVVIIAGIAMATWPWRGVQLYSTPWTWLAALPFFIAGLRTYVRIRSEFGVSKFTGETELRPEEHEQTLVTTGLHSRMRHPIYVTHLCMLAGWTIGSGLLVNFALLAINALLTYPLMIWMEERELERRFGSSYRQYKKAVPLIPSFPFYKTETPGKKVAG